MPVPVTLPVPVPPTVTFSGNSVGGALKFALTVTSPSITTLQAPVPLQPPAQPANVEPPVAVAVSVTVAPGAYSSLQSPGQSMPSPVTRPVPVPGRLTLRRTAFARTVTT